MPVSPAPSDTDVAARLAGRTLELVDVASESRSEARLAAHVARVLRDGGAEVTELGDSCILARPPGTSPGVMLAGHLDTVPAQDNIPGSIDAERVRGLGASDMKGALAVMIELVLAGAPYSALFFPREELPSTESALVPLLQRSPVEAELVIVMEPTDGELHAGCVGNINATWTFRGRSGHSARPWAAENAITRAALGIATLASAPVLPVQFHGLTFHEVASVTRINGGIAANVIPETCTAQVNFRYAPGRTPDAAEARLRELCGGLGELEITGNAASAPVALEHPLAQRLIDAGELAVAPKQAWTPVAEFAQFGYPAVNFGPGAPAQAHRRDESVEIARLLHAHRVLEALAT
ncbi:succinyl-diaminopimelate desuccinylase [Candidatus Solirubrobacter pratensis]|uniref:succinyl-diaminopimelate desuccinylase n=1 Tax=Candidatus Solirubrobacter pratensis TaxID=1298857 RepID=UPI0004024C6F|nr:succinyl-diaminopimelate desuccinylase [Candidatus Solirubrobacter pratensis]